MEVCEKVHYGLVVVVRLSHSKLRPACKNARLSFDMISLLASLKRVPSLQLWLSLYFGREVIVLYHGCCEGNLLRFGL